MAISLVAAYALGGEVADNPNGWERGLLPINCMPEAQRDPLLKKLPQDFSVWLSHRQSVISAPQQAQVAFGHTNVHDVP